MTKWRAAARSAAAVGAPRGSLALQQVHPLAELDNVPCVWKRRSTCRTATCHIIDAGGHWILVYISVSLANRNCARNVKATRLPGECSVQQAKEGQGSSNPATLPCHPPIPAGSPTSCRAALATHPEATAQDLDGRIPIMSFWGSVIRNLPSERYGARTLRSLNDLRFLAEKASTCWSTIWNSCRPRTHSNHCKAGSATKRTSNAAARHWHGGIISELPGPVPTSQV